MNVSKLFAAAAAAAAVAFAGSAFAANAPVAGAAISAVAAAAQVSVAAKSLNVPAVLTDRTGGRSRAEVKAEAVETVKHYRSTASRQFDWISGK